MRKLVCIFLSLTTTVPASRLKKTKKKTVKIINHKDWSQEVKIETPKEYHNDKVVSWHTVHMDLDKKQHGTPSTDKKKIDVLRETDKKLYKITIFGGWRDWYIDTEREYTTCNYAKGFTCDITKHNHVICQSNY